ncbi:hypothetical protein K443DRAFT_645499 [Laccaria amethystina LaAM-08-1]|uniref:Unplaced genomic scaffold K443scaffold_307, whole genome shotgun sequence n=1 Tax=Laccaria amethystina LaAM-08-1 TaxID=1095629 RepID=A0A0C9WIS9_9AGAR|nr:hypothetical protein K443DRAFT_645499 [Laccaria amethystina LaAM-08-1]
MKVQAVLLALSISYARVYGWGADGHMAVGYTAMQVFIQCSYLLRGDRSEEAVSVPRNALSFVQTSLGSTYSRSLGPAATWADTVRSEAAYSWCASAPCQFVDAEDNPPTSCSVSETRDCGSGNCILTAISNYTTRVVQTSLSAMQRQEALKFLDHFLGDITQPLHVEALELDGNHITVNFNGSSTNLHAILFNDVRSIDTGVIEGFLKAQYGNSVTTWANSFATRIKTGNFAPSKASWIALFRMINEFLAARSTAAITPLKCPLVWAQDSNAFDCLTTGKDLCSGGTSSYAAGAQPIIEEQIAKGAYRLAAWLNVLFDGSVSLP